MFINIYYNGQLTHTTATLDMQIGDDRFIAWTVDGTPLDLRKSRGWSFSFMKIGN